MSRKTVGLVEPIKIIGNGSSKIVMARIDTGATKSSIDANLASEVRAGPIIETKMIRSAHGNSLRPIITAKIEIEGEIVETSFTVAERSHMKYKMLIGQNVLKRGKFLVDPLKKPK